MSKTTILTAPAASSKEWKVQTSPNPSQGPRLTIESGSLKEVWLPAYRAGIKAADELHKLYCARKKDSPAKAAIWRGYWALTIQAKADLKAIVELGGLLLIGGAA